MLKYMYIHVEHAGHAGHAEHAEHAEHSTLTMAHDCSTIRCYKFIVSR